MNLLSYTAGRAAWKPHTLILGIIVLFMATARLLAATTAFSPGAYIIDMGQMPQTEANGLKPYGLIYQLVEIHQVPVSWAINPNKVTDKNPVITVEGADFVLRGKSYRGGPFIIASEDVTPAVTNLIAVWRAKGVVVDGPFTNQFTAPIFDVVSSFPNTVIDTQSGLRIATAFYVPAEVPASSYRVGGPSSLGVCDDIYAMPHADPQNWDAATRASFLNFILSGGSLWAACHAVSSIEGAAPTGLGFNFLTTSSLVGRNSHDNRNTVPFAYNTNDFSIWTDPLMQFLGKVDLALQGGSEEIYVPDQRGWAPHARVAVFDKFYNDARQPWISPTIPSLAAADIVFGRAYNNTNYGSIVYESSHSFQSDGVAQNTAVGRTFGNLLLRTAIERKPSIVLHVPNTIAAGETVILSATITGRGAPHTIQWSSSVGGTFSDPTALTTTYTAPASSASGPAVIRAVVTDACNRRFLSTSVPEIVAATGPGIFKTASWANSPGPAQAGDQIDYQIKLDNLTNLVFLTGAKITDFLPPNTSYKPGSANPPLSSGPDPLRWNLGTGVAEIQGVVDLILTNTFNSTSNTFDAYLDDARRGKNFGGSASLLVGGNANKLTRTLVRFNLTSLPTNSTVLQASLTLTKTGGTAPADRSISVHRVTNDWTENTLTDANGEANWLKRTASLNWTTPGGDFTATAESTNIVATANGPYSWDVSTAVGRAVAAPGLATTNGFLLRYSMATPPLDEVSFASSEGPATNAPKLTVVYRLGIGTFTRLTVSPYKLIGSQTNLPTVDVTMQVTTAGNPTNLTVTPPANLTVIATAGAAATKQAGYPSPASAIVPAGGGTVTFTYKYTITSLGTAPGSLSFQGQPANAGGATYANATSGTVLTVPTLNYSVLINAPLPPLVQRIPNTATFSDAGSFQLGTNEITSPEVIVPVNNTSPDIGIAKAVTSIINRADGRYTVTFDLAVTNLGSITLANVQVGDNLNAAFAGHALSALSVTATPGLTVNPSYDGASNTNLLTGADGLAAGTGGRITLTVTVAAGSTLAYANQAVASATDPSGTVGTKDLSENGHDPDPNHDGDPTEVGENDPTPVLLSENPAIGVTKYLATAVKNANGTFTITYAIAVENLGDVNLLALQVGDKLTTAFPAPASVIVNSLSSGQFVVNAGYNGASDTNLLAPSQTLAAGAQGVIDLVITVSRNGGATVDFTNQAVGTAVSPAGQNVSDSGTAGVTLELPGLAVTKQVASIVPNGTNFSVTMRIDGRNVGDVALKDFQLTDDLDSTFSGVQSFTVTAKSATGATINTNFNGVSDINLLVGTNTLAIGATGTVFLTVLVVPGSGVTFENIAEGAGTSTSPGGDTVTDISAPVTIAPSQVNGTLYLDHNTNGVFDAGDNFLPYVDVVITTSSNVTFTVTSDSAGRFVALVPPGSTTVNVSELDPQFPTNATLTVGSTDPTTVIVPANGAVTDDTGYVLPPGRGLVNGYLYLDLDGDGLFNLDGGDAPIANVDVKIIDRNNVTNTVVTDSHGYFARVVLTGQAIVDVITTDVDFPAGKVLTVNDYLEGSDPTLLTVPDGGVATDNTGYVTPDPATGQVIGIVYLDRNTNGVFDVADSPLTGISVAITDTNGFAVLVSTDPGGFYSLIVDVGLTVVNVLTNDPAFPAGATVTVGTTNPTTLNVLSGGTARDDNGFRLPPGRGLISGVIYIDNNHDGLYQPGSDTPIPAITINITPTNGVVQSVVTDAEGFFSLVVTNGLTVVDVVTSDPDFPANLNLTTDANNEGSDPTVVLVPNGGAATDNTGFTPLNLVPSLGNDLASTTQNTPVGGNVLLNDDPGDLPISSLTIVTNAVHGIAVLNPDGSFAYAPVPGFSGTDRFVYQLCDANGDCATATVTIGVNALPVAVNDSSTVNEDTLLSGNVAANDFPSTDGGNVWTLIAPATNGVVNFNPDGSYSYQPNPNYHGADTFRYRLCDVDGDCSTATVSITVVSVNDAPVAVNDAATINEDTTATVPVLVNDTDVDGDVLSIVSVSTTNGTASVQGTNVVFTPATNFFGTVTLSYSITDGQATNSALIVVTVLPVNDAPVAVNDAATIDEDTTATVPVLVNDSDVDGDALTIVSVSTTNGTASVQGTNVVFTPATNFYGTVTLSYSITDGNGGTNSALIVVTVLPVNDGPVAVDDSYNLLKNTTLNVAATGVLTNDLDVDGDVLTALLVTTTTHGTLSLNGDGGFSYAPASNYFGADAFTYRVTDGQATSAVATVSLSVLASNVAPVAVNDSFTTPEDTALVVPAGGVLTNDLDIDGDTLSAVLVSNPAHGTLSFNSSGGFTYTPTNNYFGADAFTYRATDGPATSGVATVSITITPVNDAPVAVDDAATIDEDTTATVAVLVNDTDVDGDPLTIVSVSTTNGTASVQGTNVVFTPATNFFGTVTLSYSITDGLATNSALIVVTVLPVNDAPVAVDDAVTINEDTTATVPVLVNDTDVDGDVLSIVSVSTTNGTASVQGTNVVFTPATDFFGTVTLSYAITDGLATNSALIVVTVLPVNDAPVAVDDAVTINEDTTATVPVLVNDTDVDGDVLSIVSVMTTNGTASVQGTNVVFTPATDFHGTVTLTYSMTDGQATNSALIVVTVLPVNDAPVAVNDAATIDEDTTATVAVLVNDSDVDGDPLTIVSVSTTNGTASVQGTNVVFTPATNFFGTVTLSYAITDGQATNSALIVVTVLPVNDAPVAVNDAATIDEDTTATVAVLVNDSDVDGDPLTIVSVSTTNGTASVQGTNVVFTPATNFFGTVTLSYSITDGQATNSALIVVTVLPVNDAPVAVNDAATINEDTTATVPVLVNDSDVDGDVLSIVSVSTTNGTASVQGTNVVFTPATDFFGTVTLSYSITDGQATNSALIIVTVLPVNDAPVAVNDTATIDEDTTATVAVLVNDSDVDGDALTIVSVSTTNGTASVQGTNVVFTPATNFFGTVTLSYAITDGQATNSALIVVTVLPVNDAPVAVDDSYNLLKNTTLNVAATGVLTNDLDVDGDVLTTLLVATTTHGTLSLNGDGGFSYAPASNYFGADAFTYRVTDGQATSAVATVSLSVLASNVAPVAVNDSFTTPEDTALVVPAGGVLTNDLDIDGDTLSAVLVSNPAHGTLSFNSTGGFTYTPTNNYVGPDSFTYRASDGPATSGVATVSITVTPVNDAPVAVDDAVTIDEDTTATVAVLVNDSDVDGDPLTIVSVSTTNGTASVQGTNVVFTPATNFFGTVTLSYAITDGLATNSALIVVTVLPVNDAPVAVDDAVTINEDTTATVPVLVNDTDVDGDVLSIVSVSTTNGTASVQGTNVVFTPATDFFGTVTLSYSITDGLATNSALIVVTVLPVNDAPVAVDDAVTINEDTTATVPVLVNDTDVDGDVLSIVSVSTTNGTASVQGTNVVFTPATDFHGTVTLTYSMTDGQATNSALIVVTVLPVNDAPVAVNDAATIDEDTTATVAVLVNDSDVDGDPLTIVSVSTTNGTASVQGTNVVFTPATNFFGTVTLSYAITDGQATNSALIVVTVLPVNDAPVAVNDAATIDEDTTATVAVLVNDSDVDGDPLTIVSVSTTNGTASVQGTNVVFTPATNFFGTVTLSYSITDGQATNSALIVVTVLPVNDAPVAVNDAATINEDTTATVPVLVNDSDVDGDVLSIVSVSTTNGTASVQGTNVVFTPATDFFGTVTLSYAITDGQATNSALIIVTVLPVNDAPVAVNDSFTTAEDTALVVPAGGVLTNDMDPDGDTLSAVLVSNPAHGTLSFNSTGGFTYTPTNDYVGPDSFTYRATDGSLTSSIATVSLTVTPVNDAPVAVNDAATIDEDTTATVAVLVNDSDVDGDVLSIVSVSTTNGTASVQGTNVVFTPATNFFGTVTLSYSITDGQATNSALIVVTVLPVNDAPVAVNDAATINEDTTATVPVLVNDSDVDGDVLSIVSVSTTNGTASVQGTNVVFTPATNFFGTVTLSYSITDGQATNSALIIVTVLPVNDAPVAVNDAATIDEDTTATVAVLVNDSDVDGDPLTIVSVSTTNGTASVQGTNVVFTPATNFFGTVTLSYAITDGQATNSALIIVTVLPVNDAPVAVDDSYNLLKNTTLNVAATGVLTNDLDVDGDVLTTLLVATTTHGTLSLNGDGGFSYAPASNYFGADAFTYRVTDGQATSAVATVSLSVLASNVAPVAVNDSFTTPEDTALVVPAAGVLTNDLDADGDILSAVLVSNPAHGTLSFNSTGGFTYTPTNDYHGADFFTYRATDGPATSGVATVSITITSVNDAPVAVDDAATIDEDTTATVAVLVNDSDVDGDPLTIVSVSTTNGTASVQGTNVVFTPATNFFGTVTLSYAITDGQATNSALIVVTVLPVNDAPLADNQNVTTPEDTALPITLTGSDVDGPVTNFVVTALPTHGSLTGSGANLIYLPATNYVGLDSFTFTVDDGALTSAVATVSITVTPVNDGPITVDDSYSLLKNTVLTITVPGVLANDTDADGDTLAALLVTTTAHGALSLDANGGFIYTPVSNYFGADAFTYRATDGQATSAVATVSLSVLASNLAPVAVNDSFTTAEDTALVVPAGGVLTNDMDPDGDTLSAVLVSNPAHGTLSFNSTGGFTYTPTNDYVGPDSFTYRATDGSLTSSIATVSLTVTPVNDAPVAVNDAATIDEDTTATVAVLVNDSDVDGDALTIVSVSTTNGTASVQGTNVVFTPATNFFGTVTLSYSITDGQATNSALIVVTVLPVNDAPVAVNDAATINEDTTATVPVLVNDTDVDGDVLSIVSVSTTNGTASVQGTNVVFTPATNFFGTVTLSYSITDGQATNSALIIVTVLPVNDAPVAVNDAATIDEDTTATVAVLVNDSDVDGDPLTIVSVSTTNGTASVQGTNVVFTPATNFFGTVTLSYAITDGQATNSALIIVTVLPVNDAPVAVDDSYNLLKNTTLNVAATGVLTNDLDVDGDVLTTLLVATTTHGTLSLNGDGGFSYAPASNYFGADAFTYRVTDGQATSAVATVSLSVLASNVAPVAVNDSFTTPEDTALVVPAAGVLTNDLDADGDILSAVLVSNPAHGTLSFNSTGGFTYTPTNDYHGADFFTYRATDGPATSGVATVSITITSVNDAPVAVDDAATIDEDTTATVAVLVNDSDVDGDPLTIVSVSTTNGTASVQGTNVVFTPATNFFGTVTLSYAITDGQATNSALIVVTVLPVNDAPLADNQNVTTPEDTALPITLTGSDVDGPVTNFVVTALPTHGSLTGSGANLIYLPATNYVGLDSFTFTVNDGALTSAVATVSITVTPVNDGPLANNQSVSTPEDTALPITLTGSDVDGPVTNFVVVASPTHGALTGSGSNLTYVPATNYNGPDSFTFTVNDGSLTSAVATVSITVTPVNDAPLALDDVATTPEDTAVLIPVLVNDTDVDGGLLTIVGVSTTNGTASIQGTNVLFTPATNYLGTVVLGYTITDGQGGTNSALITVTVTALADLTVFKSGPANAIVGSNITFVITATNRGPSTAAGVAVSDQLPAGYSFVSAVPAPASSIGGLISWTVFSLAEFRSSNFTVTVRPLQAGTFTNFAFGSSPTSDPNTNDNRSPVTTVVTELADVAVFKTGPASVLAGSNVTYIITVTNLGPSTATNVVITDRLPAGSVFQTASAGGSLSNNFVNWLLPSLAAGTTTNFAVSITAPGVGPMTNVAFGTSGTADANTNNNNGTSTNAVVITTVTPVADIVVAKSGPTNAMINASFGYTITVSNAGPSTASNVVVRDTLPAGLTYLSSSPSGVLSNNLVTWTNLTSLLNGAVASYTVTVRGTNLGFFTNVASATSATIDPNVSNNNGSNATARVRTAVTPGQFGVWPGSILFNPQTGLFEQHVTVTNLGTDTAPGLRVLVGNLRGTNGLPRTNVFLWNASGTNFDTRPYVQYNAPLDPGSNVTLLLEFYVPDRKAFTNTLEVQSVLPAVSGAKAAAGVPVTRSFIDARIPGEPRYVIEFTSIPGRVYTVLYSDDGMVTWHAATPSVTANANVTQWYDDGPPKTPSKPLSNGSRIYRAVLAPANP